MASNVQLRAGYDKSAHIGTVERLIEKLTILAHLKSFSNALFDYDMMRYTIFCALSNFEVKNKEYINAYYEVVKSPALRNYKFFFLSLFTTAEIAHLAAVAKIPIAAKLE